MVGDSLFLYISAAPLESFTFARSQSCLQGLPMIFSLLGACGDLCVYGTLSVLLALESVPLYLDSLANMEFNHKGNLAPIWQLLFLIVLQEL